MNTEHYLVLPQLKLLNRIQNFKVYVKKLVFTNFLKIQLILKEKIKIEDTNKAYLDQKKNF